MSNRDDKPTDSRAVPDEAGLRLLVEIPALNEEPTIGEVIRRIPRQIPGIASVDVLVVDDSSTDRTRDRALEAGAEVVTHDRPQGVGAAFQTALTFALERRYDVIVSIDADGQFNPATIPAVIAPVIEGRADFVTASRFSDPSLTPPMPWIKRWGNRMMSRLISHLIGRTFHDVSCGMRCYNRNAAMHLNLLGSFTYTQEVFLNLAYKNMRIAEVPVRIEGKRAHGQSRVADSLWRYAFKTLAIIFRAYRDYRPFSFFGRIALALILLASGLETFLLIHYLSTGTFTPHKWVGFLGAALFFIGLLALNTGMIGDMLNRHRVYLEEVLFCLRKHDGTRNDRDES